MKANSRTWCKRCDKLPYESSMEWDNGEYVCRRCAHMAHTYLPLDNGQEHKLTGDGRCIGGRCGCGQ